MRSTSAAARSRGKARRGPRAAPAARTAPAAVVRRRRSPLSPPPGPGCGAVSCCGGCSANQAAQQKENAQLTRAWWRRIAASERTWKSAQPQLVLDPLVALPDPVPDAVQAHDLG